MVRCRWGAAEEQSLQAKFRSLEVARSADAVIWSRRYANR